MPVTANISGLDLSDVSELSGASAISISNSYNFLPLEMEIDTTLDSDFGFNRPGHPVGGVAGAPQMFVDWGDGNRVSYPSPTNPLYTYATGGVYNIKVYGYITFQGNFNTFGKVKEIQEFSYSTWIQSLNSFNLETISSSYSPDWYGNGVLFLSNNSSLQFGDISNWDMSGLVGSVSSMFSGNTAFDFDITGWDMSNVTDFANMFLNCSSFNQDISSWDVSGASNLLQMFGNASSFDQDLGDWRLANGANCLFFFVNAGISDANVALCFEGWD